jgi:Uri superfamily endonuclease
MLAQPGTYALIFNSTKKRNISIGKLGTLQVKSGFYVYVGSAFGPGGLRARISHHKRKSRRPHWHIDYLSPYLQLKEIWYTYDPAYREHEWAGLFSVKAAAHIPLPGFGSSDCRCKAHLFFFYSRPLIQSFCSKIQNRLSDRGRIFLETVSSRLN